MQRDFGGFDPAFVGVTIRFENKTAWARFQEMVASPTPIPVSALADDERFERLSLASVLAHEVRHFHDFLISPYSALAFVLRLKTLIADCGMLPRFVAEDVNVVPVPYHSWFALDDAARAARVRELGRRADGKPWAVPLVETSLLASDARYRTQLDALVYHSCTTSEGEIVEPWQIFELSGILTQLQDIFTQYGIDEVGFFVAQLLRAQDGLNPYARTFRLAKSVWDHHELDFDTTAASAMAVWSLLGAYDTDGMLASPNERFVRLREYLMATRPPRLDDPVMTVFDEWSAALGLSMVEDGLEETTQRLLAHARFLSERRSQLEGVLPEGTVAPLLHVAERVAEASRHMADAFRVDPDAYVLPRRYISSGARFANPLMRYVADGAGFYLSAPRADHVTWWAIVQDGRELILSWLVPFNATPHSFVDPEPAMWLADMFGLSDFLFEKSGRTRGDVQFPGTRFLWEGKIAWFDLLD